LQVKRPTLAGTLGPEPFNCGGLSHSLGDIEMVEESEQTRATRPADAGSARRHASRMTDAELGDLMTARDKANKATPGLQRALAVLAIAAALLANVAVGVYVTSHFRDMDVEFGVDASGRRIGAEVDDKAKVTALLATTGALLILLGALLNVTARARQLLLAAGSVVVVSVGAGVGLLLDASRQDLQRHFHVGDWGTRTSFNRLIYTLDAFGWLVAACGVAVLVLMVVQRRRISEAYPD
jgi:hypothetical protein